MSNESHQPTPRFMGKTRVEAFSDGVIAIIITIMVLELKVPHGVEFATLAKLLPVFLGYVLSFIYVGIYWNNHHDLFHGANHVSGGVMWANLHLLFWLSLTPFVTGYMTENHYAALPVVLYGFVLLMCGVAYTVLVVALKRVHPKDSVIHRAIGSDTKGKISLIAYTLGIIAAHWVPFVAIAIFVAVALMWLVPDRRIERALHSTPTE